MAKKTKKTTKTTTERLAAAIGVPVEALNPASAARAARKAANDANLRAAIAHEAKRTPIYYVHDDGSGLVKGRGYRVAVVVAGEGGYRWTGEWPNDGTKVMPYFWGPTLEDAKRIAADQNERRFGVTPEVATLIVVRSMSRGTSRGSRRSR